MKHHISALAIFLCVWLSAQNKPVDTAQIVVPNRMNSEEAMKKPYVIMISADGFRYDYAKKYGAKNLLRLAEGGVQATAMVPSFPSITGPNHYTLVTGMYPSHTGFVDNLFYDPEKSDYFSMSSREKISDGSRLNGTPLWSLAEQQGVLSASLFWVASNSDAGKLRPTYYYDYHEKFSPEQKISIVMNWLKLPEEKRPHFITFYFPEVDKNGHFFGPDAPETRDAVKFVDETVGKLITKVNTLNLPNVNVIFVSDHGMMKVDTEKPLPIPQMLFDQKRFDFVSSQTMVRVLVKNDAETRSVFKTLKKQKTTDYDVYLTKRFPRKLHYRTSDDRRNRIGQILLIPKAPKIFLKPGEQTKSGKHGYDPYKVPEMKATFFAAGPAFKSDVTIGEFSNVNVYPVVAEILGLKYEPKNIDGNTSTAKKVLK